jgi:tetratricopeptide (TPR) repeat protein/tRNA A-37 threonylcarbamoyl transferase component Bud32
VVVPGYEVLQEVGRGGMGVVYKARQLKLNRTVALKMLLTGVHSGPEHLARFRAEAEAIARLEHPNIVHIYEVGEHKRRPFCALEFVGGGSLDKRLAGEPLPARQAAGLAQTLARAMDAAHRAGIIHRDLKPGNVLLVGGPELPLDRCLPKITDFGLAKQLDEEAWKTRSGAIMGTPSYMAPEQAGGHAERMGPCTDVYALGAMLYEFLTGRPPFRAASMMDTLDQVRYQEPVPPSRLQPKIPRDLETICLKCLTKEPAKRYASALALAEDLERFVAGQPIQARPTGSIERVVKWAKRRPAIAALVAMSALALLSIVAGALIYVQSLQRTLAERERVDDIGKQARTLIDQAKALMDKGSWQDAKAPLTQAQGMATSQAAALPDLVEQIQPLMERVDRELTKQALAQTKRAELDQAQAEARKLFLDFQDHRDRALLHSSMAARDDLEHHLADAQDEAKKALDLVHVQPERPANPSIPPALADADQGKIRQECYELLFVLADAAAEPRPRAKPDEIRAAARYAARILDNAVPLIQETAAYHVRRARYCNGAGNMPESAAEEQKAARVSPTLPLDHYLLGEEAFKQGEWELAGRHFQDALRLDATYFWARYLQAVCYVRLGRWAEAQTVLTACRSQKDNFVWVHLMLGFVYTQQKDFPAAEAAFAAAETLAKGDPEARCALYANRGLLRVVQRQVDKGIDDLMLAIRIRPGQFQVHLSLALIYEGRNEVEKAREEFAQAITLQPDRVDLYRNRARFHLRRNDLKAALADFETAIRKEAANGPSHDLAKLHGWRGRIRDQLHEHKEAVAAYDQALAIWQDYTDAYLWRGVALLQIKSYEAGAASLDRYLARRLRPTAAAYRARALARTMLRQYAEAARDYSRALELESGTAAAHLARGLGSTAGPTPLGGLTDFAAALEIDRGRAAIYAARGSVYLAGQAPPAWALPDFEEALRIDPHSGEAYNGRGLAQVRLGHYAEGVADAEKALKNGPATNGPAMAELRYGAARVFAQAAAAVRAKLNGTDRDRLNRALADRYRDRALSLLSSALASRPAGEPEGTWQKRLQGDSALEPIRRDPRFLRLINYPRPAVGQSSPK